MVNTGGFTRSYRRKWEHPAFRSKQEAAVWAWMCDIAQWQPSRISTRLGPVTLERGELLFSERMLEDEFGLHRNAVRRLLSVMEKERMIAIIKDRCPHRCGTVASIVNYDKYQVVGCDVDTEKTESGPKDEPKADHNSIRSGTKNNEYNKPNEGNERDSNPAQVDLLGEAAFRPETQRRTRAKKLNKPTVLEIVQGPLPDGWGDLANQRRKMRGMQQLNDLGQRGSWDDFCIYAMTNISKIKDVKAAWLNNVVLDWKQSGIPAIWLVGNGGDERKQDPRTILDFSPASFQTSHEHYSAESNEPGAEDEIENWEA